MSKFIRRTAGKKQVGSALIVALQLTALSFISLMLPFNGGSQQSAQAPADAQMRAAPPTQTTQAPTASELAARRASAVRATRLYEPRATQILNLAASRAESAQQSGQHSVMEGEETTEATLTTDLEDYSPFSYVYISGTGFEPGETVNMIVVELDPNPAAYEPWDVVADENGNIDTSWYIFSEEFIGATMQVTATGLTSGLSASATFTDAAAPTLHENSARTIKRDAFAWGDTVYVKGNFNGQSANRCYKVEWVNPSGTIVQTTNYEPNTFDTSASFVVPSGPSGVWTVRLYEATGAGACSGATFPGSPTATANFDVARAVIIGATATGGVGGDNWVREQQPTVVQTGDLDVDSKSGNQNRRSFVRFDLTGAGISGTVDSAKMRMLLSAAPNNNSPLRTHGAHRVTATWVESGIGGITWNNQPAFNASATNSQIPGTTNNVLVRWTLTPDVQGFVDSSLVNYGWCVKDATEGASGNNTATYKATDSNTATDKTQGPVLLVDYSAPTPTPTPGTTLTVATASSTYGGSVGLSATLTKTSDSSPVVGRTVSFTLNGNAAGSGVTNGSGVATVTVDPLCGASYNVGFYPTGVAASFAGDGSFAGSSGSNSLTVGKANATVVVTPYSVTYDGNPHTATYTITGVCGETDATVGTIALSTTHRNAGTYSSDSWSFTGTGNYNNIASTTITDTISTLALTINAVTDSKTYDGNATSSGVPSFVTLVGGDTGSAVQVFDSKNAGARTLSVTSYTISDGNGGANYGPVTTNTAAGSISTLALTINAVTDSKTYDGNTASSGTPSFVTLVGGDTGSAVQIFDSKNAGARTLSVSSYTISDGNGGANYGPVTLNTASGTISTLALTVNAVTDSKTYDGNTASSGTPSFVTLVGGDTGSAVQEFDSKNAGSRTLSVSSYTISDSNGGANYGPVTTNTAAGTITAASLDIYATTDSKSYDGTTSSSATPTYSPSPLYDTDTVTGLTQAFVSKNVLGANGSTLQVTAYTVNDGNSGNNYSVTLHTATGTITAVSLDIYATTDSKTYDGTTSSSATPTTSGLQTGDSVTGLTQAFQSKNVLGVNGSTLEVTAYMVNDGNSGGNYSVMLHTASGTITAATVTASIVGNPTKTYDGTINATLTAANFSLTGVVAGESITVTKTTGTYNSKDVLAATTVTTSLASGDFSAGGGTLLSNYTLPVSASGPGHITTASLTITATNRSKIFGVTYTPLTTNPSPDFTVGTLYNGDSVASITLTCTGYAAGATVAGSPYTIMPSAAVGVGLTNYTITYLNGSFTINSWNITGFYQPVEMNNVINTVKGGSTVPLKFNIYAGGVEKTSVSDVMYGTVQVAEYGCQGGPEDPMGDLPNTGATALRYDTAGHQFIQNWQTPKAANKCYRVRMTAIDGSVIEALFKTK